MLGKPRSKKWTFLQRITRIVVFFLALTASAQGLELSFKISGGYAYLKLDSIHHSLDDWARRKKLEERWLPLGSQGVPVVVCEYFIPVCLTRQQDLGMQS